MTAIVATNGSVVDAKPEEPKPAGLAQRGPTPLEPSTLGEAWELARWLGKSSIVPDAYRDNPANVLAAIYMGRDLGISPMQAMREIYVVHGRPASSALLKVALVRQSPLCLFWRLVESTGERAVFETQRVGDPAPTKHVYTLEDAKQAGLYPPSKADSNWGKRPKLMLRRRCESELADEVYPDVVKGLRTEDEADEIAASAREMGSVQRVPKTTAPVLPEPAPTVATEPKSPASPKPNLIEDVPPDEIDVFLAELKQVDDLAGMAARAEALASQGHPRRQEVLRALQARKTEIGAKR
ncbi:MAG TPA: recombinase RecT [Gemmatimonadales bacterium]|nr:recombinase RecT [Gemmatimonadales bacterium]